ncbi:ATP-binding protein [Pedobacter chinensis]|uniref:ATP-binding protein n=1 Tax=Pedobacter chinensis TaxID=2282421 RepID=A0A369PP26_9SPHI|nr:ATP-binding protein [Pedobacter chinensis]RDC54361.1 ATP-binding protein [Pedobacter chinensis]
MKEFANPFRPGAGQPPPYLAGRDNEKEGFKKLLGQNPILKNVILTGLRGVGKTVLLETLRPIALQEAWFWAGNDLSESASVSELALSTRVLADIAPLVSSFVLEEKEVKRIGFGISKETFEIKLNYQTLVQIYNNTPGLESDKLKTVLEIVWDVVKTKVKGIVLAYDEAQILKDKAADKQYPLSLLLEVVQYLQKKEIPYLLVLTGLPTLFPNLVESRTYAERMFNITTLDRLDEKESREAILKPINKQGCPVTFTEYGISEILKYSSGYPYFIQFFCKEAFDIILQQIRVGVTEPNVSVPQMVLKLDSDFYSGRWSRITDRQRDLLMIIASLPNADSEFTNKEIADKSIELKNIFKTAHINNSLLKLIEAGLIFKNRRGKYSFAVPLLANYIKRQDMEALF